MDSNITPLVTVVTLTYQRYERLFQCIDSVLNQDYQEIEYIVSDDGCDSFPMEKIKRHIEQYKKSNLKNFIVIKNDENVGTAKHQKNAFAKAHGKYVINLAGDDEFYDKTAIDHIVDRFIELRCNVLCTSRIVFSEHKKRPLYYLPHLMERKIIKKKDTPYKQYKALISDEFYDMASGSSTAFNREEFLKIGYDGGYKLIEDFPFYVYYTWNDNVISFAHDIVSVKYYLGGVSNTSNSIAKKDMLLFNNRDREAHIEEMDFFTQKRVRFYQRKIVCENNRERFLVCLKYPLQCADKIIYNLRRKFNKCIDKIYIYINEVKKCR